MSLWRKLWVERGKGLVNWWTITWILCTIREQKKSSLGLQATQQAWLYTSKDTAPQSVVTVAQSGVVRGRSTAQSAVCSPQLCIALIWKMHSPQQRFLAPNCEPPKRETYRSKNRTGPVTWPAVQQTSVNKKKRNSEAYVTVTLWFFFIWCLMHAY